jgi:hypothetical protein
VLGVPVGQIEAVPGADARRDRLIDERVERRDADRAQHAVPLGGIRTDMSVLESPGGHRRRLLNG